MDRITKSLTLILILTMTVSSLTMFKPAFAQSITKPSVPEFTMKYSDYSYDEPPVYGIDPNTDEKVVVVKGYHVDNRSIQFSIKNQPFTPFTDPSSGRTIDLFYNIKYKFGSEWISLFGGERMFYAGRSDSNFSPYTEFGYPIQNYTSQYTIITYNFLDVPRNGRMDIQVQALEGYTNSSIVGESHIFFATYDYAFYGEKSGWSSIQTINLATGSVSISTSPTPTPSVPEFSWLIILPLLLSIFAVTVIFRRQNKKGQETLTNHSQGSFTNSLLSALYTY
jgi:hypothetical protein